MARPKVPLITRRETLEVALRIIDAEGLDALSIRRLASELDVNGASLYHHFENKDEILAGVAALALKDARKPEDPDVDWREWFLQTTVSYRNALLAHPGLVAIVLSRHPLRIGLKFSDDAAVILTEKGLPIEAVMPLIETVESFVIGTVVYHAAAASDDTTDLLEEVPNLRAARAVQAVVPEELFVPCVMALMDSILDTAEAAKPRKPVRRPRRKSA